jgi:S-layer like family, C-terminal region
MNETQSASSDRREDLNNIYGHNLVAFGDFRAAQQILALSPVASSLRLTLSRFFQAESVKHDNLILIGGKKANPWVYLFDDQMTFSLNYDDARGPGYIANRHPRPGEAASYTPSGFEGYSVVAYLPNPSHNGNVIILAGTDSDATSAAAEFLTSEEQLNKFQNTLHVQRFPYFEVLLKTSRLSGTSFSSELLAYRTYPSLHQE